MAGSSLFKRLERGADPSATGRAIYRGDDLEAAVLENLQRMLNTRQGSSLSAPEYGIVELSELLHDFPNATGIMQRCIKNAILKYEPRLKNVQVRALEGEDDQSRMFVYYEITAQVVHPDGDRQAIRFSTSVDESSNVVVS